MTINYIPTDDPNIFTSQERTAEGIEYTVTYDFSSNSGMPEGYWRKQLSDWSVAQSLRQYNRAMVRLAWLGALRARYGVREREVG